MKAVYHGLFLRLYSAVSEHVTERFKVEWLKVDHRNASYTNLLMTQKDGCAALQHSLRDIF